MTACSASFGQIAAADFFRDWVVLDYRLLIILGTYIAVTIVAFIWAAFFRKRARSRRHHVHHRSQESPAGQVAEKRKSGWSLFPRRKHRRRHRRPRNPTLAEAGGLPPVRSPGPPPPSS